MKNLFLIISFPVVVLMTNVANAYDFHGASVTVKEVPISMWRMGINGNYPIINSITLNSPAAKAGLSEGNIILSVNDRVIRTVSDLDTFTTNVLSVKIFKGNERKTIIIDRVAIEAEKAKRIAEEIKSEATAAMPKKETLKIEEHSNNSPPIAFDDAELEKKYGKSTPAELVEQRQKALDVNFKEIEGLIKQRQDDYNETARKIKDSKEYRQKQREEAEIIMRGFR